METGLGLQESLPTLGYLPPAPQPPDQSRAPDTLARPTPTSLSPWPQSAHAWGRETTLQNQEPGSGLRPGDTDGWKMKRRQRQAHILNPETRWPHGTLQSSDDFSSDLGQ